ncbi:chemotaxis protein CheB [Kineosporia mesophila]|uniref:protein-glutamate methylesterase n=1 Tax=Kineosporia mesophila TaxID=566012 RepID=A0ABP6Z0U7_9ACTN|nr:chemotaxis protein CheB [Kineosporia mesophila]
MAVRDVVVVGASAGGVEAISALLAPLPAELPACVLVVLHTPASGVNALATILSRATALNVVPATGQTPLRRGTVIVARPDHHLLVTGDQVVLTRGPRENGHRPAVDVLFRSAARVLGPRVLGIVLSGTLDDGSTGLVSIRHHGGIGMVQAPDDALHPGMPTNAIDAGAPEFVLPVAAMAARLTELTGVEVPDAPDRDDDLLTRELAVAALDPAALHRSDPPGRPAGFGCPDCYGSLFEIEEHGQVRYRCRVGHAWSMSSLLARSDAATEGALWMALRALEEKAALARQMSGRATDSGQKLVAARFADNSTEAWEAAELVRRLLLRGPSPEIDPAAEKL